MKKPIDCPKCLETASDQAHAGLLAAHLGSERTLAQLKDSYYWPGMSKDVQAWCNACDVCARSRGPPPRAHGDMVKVTAAAVSYTHLTLPTILRV